ncbi:MAG: CPBP family intramembrane metalloprotease, partial [Erysipelotrichaceae bacterium]|nr:CPBP family intramembrane metalloprotease [Erysipelotrichaceae bacterium]
ALMFALYHISIVDTWFSSVLVFFSIAGLCVIGAILQYIAIKEDNLLGSWLVHAAANLAINTIGTIMLFR